MNSFNHWSQPIHFCDLCPKYQLAHLFNKIMSNLVDILCITRLPFFYAARHRFIFTCKDFMNLSDFIKVPLYLNLLMLWLMLQISQQGVNVASGHACKEWSSNMYCVKGGSVCSEWQYHFLYILLVAVRLYKNAHECIIGNGLALCFYGRLDFRIC